MNLEQDAETGTIVLCAVRYCIGRQTYMPSLVVEWVKRHWESLPLNDRVLIFRDVKREIERGQQAGSMAHLGADCDVETWVSFYDWMRKQSASGWMQVGQL